MNREEIPKFKRHQRAFLRRCKHRGLNADNRVCRICGQTVPKVYGPVTPERDAERKRLASVRLTQVSKRSEIEVNERDPARFWEVDPSNPGRRR